MANTCRMCGRPIPSPDPRRVTCGHPRCKRARDRGEQPVTKQPTIPDLVRRAQARGMTTSAALVAVARTTGEPVAVVQSVWRAAA